LRSIQRLKHAWKRDQLGALGVGSAVVAFVLWAFPFKVQLSMRFLTALGLTVALLAGCSGGSPAANSTPDGSMVVSQPVATEMATQVPAPYTSQEICSTELKAAYEGTKEGANFQNCNFVWATFLLADFSGDDFSGANLNGANLGWVNFRRATLSGASLRGADLRGSDLRGADLTGVDFTGANLRKALIANRQFVFVILCQTTLPDGSVTDRNC
jgi:uncharacterized protein YjbI with pentapeptide repeats